MALDITAQDIIIDETTGLQGDDINPIGNNDPTLAYLLSRDSSGGLTSPEVAFQSNFVVATANAGETITSVVLTQNSSGTPFSTTVGVNSGIRTVNGNYVWLFQDPTHSNVVIGVIGTSSAATMPAATGDLAFSFGLVSTSATNADLYLVQYVPLLHPDANDPNDQIDLLNKVYASVTGTTVLNFSQLGDAPPGHNNWYILDADTASTQKILVTAHDGTTQAEVNVSTQGLGVSSQDVRFGRELQIDLISGGTQSAGKNFTNSPLAPNYTGHIENVSGAGFSISQSTPTNTVADIEVHAYNNDDNAKGAALPGDDNDTEINITGVTFKLNGIATTASALGITVDLNGTGMILHNVGEGVTVDFTTEGGSGGTFDRFTIKNIDGEKDYFDVKEVHFAGNVANAHNEQVGSFINFNDDGPSISTTGTEPTLTVDETVLGTNDTKSFAANFSSAFGADGAGTVTYALGFTAGSTGLVDTATGQAVVLSLNGGVIQGRTATSNDLVFTVSVDASGNVTLDQIRAVVHPTSDPDESTTLAADNLIKLTATVTDKDGDHAPATLDIGQNLNFKDDGPSISTTGTEPTLTVDDTVLTTNDTKSFAANFSTAFGADGAGTVTYALGFTAGSTGLTDTLTGQAVVLSLNGTVIEGRTATSNDLVFTVSVSGTGSVTLDQLRAVVHPTSDPDESKTLDADNLVTLTATITDKDGDHTSTTLNIGQNLTFKDDGPTITVPFDGDASGGGSNGTHETLGNAVGQTASGAFGYDIGSDGRPASYYDATHSDFVDQDGVLPGIQLSLDGNLTGLVPGTPTPFISSFATLQSESATEASFNWQISYDSDPNTAGNQMATAGGTLVFNKDSDTYTITLNDAVEGFTRDILHTSELLSKQPTSNTGHPLIVVEKLFEADSTPETTDRDFFVQFTANSATSSIPLGLGDDDGAPVAGDKVWNPGQFVTNNNEDWVSATQTTNGVAGDTIQKGEALTLRFFDTSPGISTDNGANHVPTQTANDMAIKFDGIGNEDLMVIVNLVSTANPALTTTKAIYISNADIYKTGQVPSAYAADFQLDNNDGLVIIERNDYNGAGENWVLQGVQIMQSGNGLVGAGSAPAGTNAALGGATAIDLNSAVGANGGSLSAPLVIWDNDVAKVNGVDTAVADNDVIKIVDIGFTTTQTTTPDAHLDFGVQIADADGDMTTVQHILVDIA
ncbi:MULTISPECIES: DUF5801 repeats-in-toxin domain-containing protein [unclassified Mesorhizobium]|uniref:DUF5801 repeats-in-toxin domain-containing protein n=3 Tax=Mesorhizobium TaxID=68287 RepID=UPI000BAFE418|nr:MULTISPECIES: DUF5801 repeats-in-toxin domain-containing protein [unclassified Mesorhizobium]PBB30653.1 hypothetical protein CK214_19415 [Mesorhizobium sp. WSM3882]RUV84482.1 hypothetical protein EOA51_21685 [Mesorhizobium sp. M1A.F.Ca.IN.020.32.1.1]RWF83479.1 MAG: hypothetical protein EOQ35_06020 [Mesorhizobium sp.]RWF97896.1 MAG: hypothetical protein EOQ38_21780 [Mesorhizobium sp.]RWG83932.1 MAG: hypothetical protein EOQ68_14815 [Mesorhizobium sp.]